MKRLNEDQGIRESSVLDAFPLFYEELIISKPAKNRIRRPRPVATSHK